MAKATTKRSRYQVDLRPDDVILDNSTMATVMKCSTMAVVEHGLGLKPKGEGPQMKQGQAGHAALATWFEGASDEDALSVYSEQFHAVVEPALDRLQPDDKERTRLALPRSRQIIAEWMEARPRDRFPLRVDPPDVELAVSAPLMELKDGRRVIYVALLDALGTRRTGGRWSIDHKFTRAITEWWKGKQEDTAQFTGQLWLAGEHGLELAGIYVNAIEISTPRVSQAKCRDHGVAYAKCDTQHARHDLFPMTRSKVEIASWLLTLKKKIPAFVKLKARIESLDDIATVPMEGRLSDACLFCGMREWCRVGRPTRGTADWFVADRWDPLAERRART